jgi:UDP-3-O-[3-hydroxymyristoyl] glucosamine N-acyltransferase
MQFTAQEIASLLNGTVEGDPSVAVNQLAKIEEATQGTLSFLANPKYEQVFCIPPMHLLLLLITIRF